MEKMIGAGKKVCITGASGYIASWIVKLLLDRGYTVHGTVRDPNDPKRTEHLMALDGAKERLMLFKADLAEEGSFFSAIDGCDGVFHTATPVNMDAKDPQVEIVDAAVNGTLDILATCAKVPSVKRVVLTSSMAAIDVNGRPRGPDVVIDETWFSDPAVCKELKIFKNMNWYLVSKTLAEDAAWKFAKENSIDMVVMNPAVVIGALLQPTLNGSSWVILDLINGAETYVNATFGWVHVEDVARAHILAYEIPSANGRYCLAESVAHLSEIVQVLHELYPTIRLPYKCADDGPFAPTYQISKDKAKSLGIEYIPLKTSIKDAVESLREKKLVNF